MFGGCSLTVMMVLLPQLSLPGGDVGCWMLMMMPPRLNESKLSKFPKLNKWCYWKPDHAVEYSISWESNASEYVALK